MSDELARMLVAELASLPSDLLRPLVERLLAELAIQEPPELLTSEEAAEYLRTTPRGVHDRVHRGRLKALHDGGRLLFRRADLEAYLESPKGRPRTHDVA